MRTTRTHAGGWERDLTEEGIEPNPGPRFVTKNLNGVTDLAHWERVLLEVKREHRRAPITAIFVQEHNLKRVSAHIAKAYSLGFEFFAASVKGNDSQRRPYIRGGTGIIIPRDKIETKAGETYHDATTRMRKSMGQLPNGRGIAIDAIISERTLRLASVYAHSDREAAQRPAFFKSLRRLINRRTIMGIDANCVPDVQLDVSNHSHAPYVNTGANELQDVTVQYDLIDVAREWLGDSPFFTSFHNVPGGRLTSTRIDRIYAPNLDGLSAVHEPGVHDFFARPKDRVELDHEPAVIRTVEATGDRGHDVARINERVYDNPGFNSKLAQIITETIEHEQPAVNNTWRRTWEKIKFKIKEACIKESKRLSRTDTKRLKATRRKRDSLKRTIDAGHAHPQMVSEYMELGSELRAAQRDAYTAFHTVEESAYAKGAAHDIGSASFFRPFTPRGSAHWINSIFNADWSDSSRPQRSGTHETEAHKIAAAITPYYKSLFSHRTPVDPEACLRTLRTGKRVQPPTAAKCDAPISAAEIEDVMNTLPTGKSAGPDAIPNAFYKVFSAVLAPILESVYAESKAHGELPDGCSDGLISLLYKKKDRDDPRNYRPITLLNGDYKIMMRVLAARMAEAVVQFVSNSQTGFVPDAFIGENIMLLKLIQAHAEEKKLDAYFVFLDMEKAFDRCSWDFLIPAMRAIGFGDDFISYIELAYSQTNAPSRKLHVNGYLGPSFNIRSGVAQGCPISPLLFLLITEPLSRLFNEHQYIEGIKIGGVRFCISQYADDSTLICSLGDEDDVAETLEVWQKATCMSENADKREGQLLGKLNRERRRAPTGVIANDAWLEDGKTIRALGVPMGNEFSITEWFSSRYRTVKSRIALWPSIRRLSLTGRNLLLQSIFYGSFRYWLYFLVMPQSIIDMIESDAKQILWATEPVLLSNESGTSKRSRRYIHRKASYLPVKKGGGGIMNWPLHCQAFYAQWIVRYLHPRRAPWKIIADQWLFDGLLGTSILVANAHDNSGVEDVPTSAPYLRECLAAFHALGIRQDTRLLDHTIQAESLWHNWRFTIDLPDQRIDFWQNTMETVFFSDLLDQHDDSFDSDEWDSFFTRLAPNEPIHRLRTEIGIIWQALDDEMFTECVPPDPNMLTGPVAIVHKDTHTVRYVHAESQQGTFTYHELWLDVSNRPHRTGRTAPPQPNEMIQPVEIWDDTPSEPPPDYGSPIVNEIWERMRHKEHAIIGPFTRAFPRNVGWRMKGQMAKVKSSGLSRKLSDLTIHEITKHTTSRITKNVQPNCIHNWKNTKHGIRFAVNFRAVFQSFGTELSDPTEERQWRKLVHRAINVRNRDPTLEDWKCRVCNRAEESMLHLVQCLHTRSLWKAVLNVCHRILQAPDMSTAIERAIIFNQANPKDMLPIAACAYIRHAFNCFYHDFANVDKGHAFTWQRVYYDSLISFRSAVLRHAERMRRMHTHRIHTSLPEEVSQEDRDKFECVIKIDPHGSATLNPAFTAAIDAALAQLKALQNG